MDVLAASNGKIILRKYLVDQSNLQSADSKYV
jgi:hypothetical protein